MKRLFYPPPVREFIVVIALLLIGNQLVLGEGSKDFWDYDGFRLFYLIAPTGNISNEQQTKVYAREGEFINVGSSHVGIVGGFIQVYRPDGSLHSTFDGNNGTAIINNNVEELAGPTGGGSTNGQGYMPGVIQVQSGEAGIWSVVLDYPPANESASLFPNIENGTAWTRANDQPTNGRVSLAWDITITQSGAGNSGGTVVEGRVYSNEYRSMISGNGSTTSPTFFILTRSGFLYQVEFDMADPFGFPIFSNSRGIVDGTRMATYNSWDNNGVIRSSDPSGWAAGSNYLFDPQAEDMGLLWNNKIFFNQPDPNMPASALVTDIHGGNNTHTTWLFNQVSTQNVGQNPFGFSGDGASSMVVGQGGNFVYSSQVAGLAQLKLDLNNNGSFDDPVDRIIEAEASLGDGNVIFWDGRDGQGNVIPANPNFQFNYALSIRGGEVHIMMDDIENNIGGVTFTRLNGVGSPNTEFYYDHTNVQGPVSGGGTPGNAQATTMPYTYSGNAGNERLLDFWAFVEASNFGSGVITIAIVPPPIVADNDGDGIEDADDLDDDNDGISDAAELAVAGNNGDTDGDGVPDIFDLDSDNDGISDLVEAGHGQADTNGDGIIDGNNFGNNGLHNSLENSDGLTAVINYTPADPDNDGIPDHIDLDSDNDGLYDVVEANYGGSDANNDGRIDDGTGNPPAVDANGLTPAISPTITGVGIPFPPDTDGDGVPDWHDLDSDNDGIYDVVENLNFDPDGDGIIGGGTPIVNTNGIVVTDGGGTTILYNPVVVNTDGTGQPDYRDLDSDGDGLLDTQEAGLFDGDNNGILGSGVPTVDVNGVPSTVDGNGNTITSISNPRDTNGDGRPDFQEVTAPPVQVTCDGTTTPVLAASSGGGNFCPGSSTLVAVSGITNGVTGPADFTWTGPAGFSQTGRVDNVNSVYQISLPGLTTANSGAYTLSVTTDDGCTSAPVSITVSVQAGPTASIAGPAGGVCGGESLQLTATNLGAGTNYEWFRDGVSLGSTSEAFFNIGATAGSYTVVATQNGCPGAVSNAYQATISAATPTPSLGGPAGGVCSGTNLQLTASDLGAGTNYEWFRDGISLGSTSDAFFNIGAAAGAYTVVATQNGCPSGASNAYQATITAPPVVGIGALGDLCGGGDIQLTATSLGAGTTYSWYRNGQFIISTTDPFYSIPNATSANSGNYAVAATQNGCIGSLSAAQSVSVGQGPNAAIGGVGEVCSGEQVVLTASDLGAGTTYEWFRDGVSLGATSEPRFPLGGASAAISGGYTVIASQNGCSGAPSGVATLSVSSTSQIESRLIVDNPVLCEGEDFVIQANEAIGNVTYQWFLDGAPFSITNRPQTVVQGVTLANTGSYSVEVTQQGCNSVLSSAVDVTVVPNIALGLTADQTNLCGGEAFTLNVQSTEPGLSYDWLLDGTVVASTSEPSLSITGTAADAGTYTVVPRNSQCNGAGSNPVVVSITDSPSGGSITAGNPSLCAGESLALTSTDFGAGTTYNWYLDGQLISSTSEPSYTVGAAANTAGTYTMIPSRNGCDGTASNAINITVAENVEMPVLSVDDPTICGGSDLVLNASGVGGTPNYEWFQDGGSLGATSAPFFSVPNPTAGSYTVVVSGGQCGDGSSNAVAVTVSDTPAAGEIATPNNSLCAGDNLSLISTDLGESVSYNWYLDGALISTTGTPSYEAGASAGTYTMIPSIGSCEGPTSNSVQVTVGEATAAPSLTGNNNLCGGDALTLNASGVGGDASYEWFRDGESIGTTDQPTLTVDAPTAGNYTVTAAVGDCGGGTSEALAVTVSDAPTTGAVTLPNPSVCDGDQISLTTADAGEGAVYSWFLNGELVTTTDVPSYEVAASAATTGTYSVNTAIGSCEGMPSEGVAVSIAEPGAVPTLSINGASDNATSCPGEGVTLTSSDIAGATGYEWFRDGESIGTSEDGNFDLANPVAGSYTVAATGGCSVDPSGPVGLTLNELPTVTSTISPIPNLECSQNSTDIQADLPMGVSGTWSSSDPNVVFSNPNSPSTTVSGLGSSSSVTWTLSDEVCGAELSSTSSTINVNAVSGFAGGIADVLTPNNDGLNDALRIPDADCVNVGLKVFNRWGDLVYETDRYNNNNAWEGTHDGDPLPPGPYYYLLTEPGSDEKRSGCVSIYR